MNQYYNYQFTVSWEYEPDEDQPEWGDYIGS